MISRRELFATLLAPTKPNLLIGDSLSLGMKPFAEHDGYRVIHASGRGIDWFSTVRPFEVNRMVIMLGTNDVRYIKTGFDAVDYVKRLEDIVSKWNPDVAVWATPCRFRFPLMERGSLLLSQTITNLVVSNGRNVRGIVPYGDGVHPNGRDYERWWNNLSL